MRMFYDTESDIILTEEQLRGEYEEYKGDIEISCGATTFEESIQCATSKNGCLIEIKQYCNAGKINVILKYEGEYIRVGALTSIDFIDRFGETCIYFIDNGLGEEWEISVKDVIKIEA